MTGRRRAPAVTARTTTLLILASLMSMFLGATPADAKTNWSNAYEPPTTIDILKIWTSNGDPQGTCQVQARYSAYDFRTYVKEVLPNEWISSWPSDSLRAGAEAVKEYGWWATMNTSYNFCASSNNADVTNSTWDQYWVAGSATAATTEAVNRTFATRMYDSGAAGTAQIWRAQYRAGTSTDACGQVSGATPGTTMGQWGSRQCALDGVAWMNIVAPWSIPTSKYYSGIPSGIENANNLQLNPTFEYNGCGTTTTRWLTSTGVTATTTCSSTNNIEGTHFSRVDGTGSGNTNAYTLFYQDSPEDQTAGTTFLFSFWFRCLSPIPCTVTPRMVGLGGTQETFSGTTWTFSDSNWHYVAVTGTFSYAHTQVRGMVYGSGKIKYDVDLTKAW